jgi:hypothetical protein
MSLFGSLRSWWSGAGDAPPPSAPESPPPVPEQPPPPEHASVESRQERLASRLLDDERLRGDLTDDDYQPLLDWALGLSDKIAASTADLDDAAAEPIMDAKMAALKQALQRTVKALSAQDARRPLTPDAALADLGRRTARILSAKPKPAAKPTESP